MLPTGLRLRSISTSTGAGTASRSWATRTASRSRRPPDLKALAVHGYRDLSASSLLSRFVLERSTRAPSAHKRLFFGTDKGDRMFCLRTKSRAELAKDVRGFFETARRACRAVSGLDRLPIDAGSGRT